MSVAAARTGGAGPFSAFERMVAWRYLRSRRKETVISVIAGISFTGIDQARNFEVHSPTSAASCVVRLLASNTPAALRVENGSPTATVPSYRPKGNGRTVATQFVLNMPG